MQLVYRVATHQYDKARHMKQVLEDNCVPARIRTIKDHSTREYWDVLVANVNYDKAARIVNNQQWKQDYGV